MPTACATSNTYGRASTSVPRGHDSPNGCNLPRVRRVDTPNRAHSEAIRKPCRPVVAISSSILAILKLRTTTRSKSIQHKIDVTDLYHGRKVSQRC
jgi:hypothetical protein